MARNCQPKPGFAEFITLTAMMMSLVALSIDSMLPALPEIGKALNVLHDNTNQLVISVFFLGLASGQLLYGPLSDSIGRKPAIYIGYTLFITGCLLSITCSSYPVMLTGRLLQGFGAAGPYIVSLALVRDQYEGRTMARVMSFVMSVFTLVPIIAPALGQEMIELGGWRAIFATLLLLALTSLLWFSFRQHETLAPENRHPFSPKSIVSSILEILRNRHALGYTITSGLVFGAFLGYLNSAQQIFEKQYALGTRFPRYFALLAFSVGIASYVNARLVQHHTMESISRRALLCISMLSAIFLIISLLQQSHPPLWALMTYLLFTFFCTGILFGNLNSLAMGPLGHMAGIGAGMVGSLSTFISLIIGTTIGQSYNNTVLPLTAGFFMASMASLTVMAWAEKETADRQHTMV